MACASWENLRGEINMQSSDHDRQSMANHLAKDYNPSLLHLPIKLCFWRRYTKIYILNLEGSFSKLAVCKVVLTQHDASTEDFLFHNTMANGKVC